MSKIASKQETIHYAMEATGVYHESLSAYLHKAKKRIYVVLPTTVKYFARSLNEKSKTDTIDAQIIAQMISERNLSECTPPKKEFIELRELSRFRGLLVNDRARYKNVMEASTHSADTPASIIRMTNKMIDSITKEIEKCEVKMRAIVDKNQELKVRFENICTIPGIGFITAVSIVAETFGFELFKSRISKKGNANIRRCLYLPALTAARGRGYSDVYQRIVIQGKPPKVALVAVARRMLLLRGLLIIPQNTFPPLFTPFAFSQNR